MRPSVRAKTIAALAVLIWVAAPSPVSASDPIILDSVFSDWAGEMNQTDACGDIDQAKRYNDLVSFWWADNDGVESVFFRLERATTDCAAYDGTNGQTDALKFTIYIDTNNNGVFTENVDRKFGDGQYTPKTGNISEVVYKVHYGDDTGEIASYQGDWGESVEEGGLNAELTATFAELGITANQTIRMYVETEDLDRVPDTGDIQWSPVNILGYPLLGVLMLAGILLIWRFRGRYAWKRA